MFFCYLGASRLLVMWSSTADPAASALDLSQPHMMATLEARPLNAARETCSADEPWQARVVAFASSCCIIRALLLSWCSQD